MVELIIFSVIILLIDVVSLLTDVRNRFIV